MAARPGVNGLRSARSTFFGGLYEIQNISVQITGGELSRSVEGVINVLCKLDAFMIARLIRKRGLRCFRCRDLRS